MRVYELARKHKMTSEEMVKLLQSLEFPIKNHMSSATDEMVARVTEKLNPTAAVASATEPQVAKRRKQGELKTNLQDRLARVRQRMQQREEMARKKAEMLKNVVSAPERRTDPMRVEAPAAEAAPAAEPPVADKVPPDQPAPAAGEEQVAAEAAPVEPPAEKPPEKVRATIRDGELFRPKLVQAAPDKTAAPRSAPGPQARSGAGARTGPGARPGAKPGAKPGAGFIMPSRKRRRRKRRSRDAVVDRKAVEATLKSTLAALDGSGTRKRRRAKDRAGDSGEFVEPAREIVVSEFLTVAELANQIDRRPSEVVAKLMELGQMATINQRLDFESIEMVALEFDYGVRMAEDETQEVIDETDPEDTQVPRPPVVTIMGHVDHGKTSLLDFIRKANVIAGEAGGITQHIGAYNVETPEGGRITYLDTPGHEAFSAMRARGAQVTDCVVLVVSATESVMPQTVEAIDHAKAAGVPIIVAVNKIDLPEANPERVRQQLTEYGLVPEDWGGKTIFADISAKTGEGVDKLQEMIALQTELLELKARPDRLAMGRVLEAELDKGKGPLVNVLVQRGTLSVGDAIVAGPFEGRVRAMLDERQRRVESVGPSTAIQVLGVGGVPQAGDSLVAYATDDEAHRVAQSRTAIKREQDIRFKAGATVGDWARRIADGEIKDLKIIIKGDVGGSVEALSDTLERIEHPEVRVAVIRRGVGQVTESDVLLAAASEAMIIAFHVVPDAKAREVAHREQVTIREYDVIYEAEDDIKKLLEGMLGVDVHEEVIGRVEVRELFKVPKVGTVAGCYVLEGSVSRGARVRVIRDGVVLHVDQVETLRRFKDDAREVAAGFECGIRLASFADLKVGDQFELLKEVEVARTLA
jgi:translation initiation factor IF-2